MVAKRTAPRRLPRPWRLAALGAAIPAGLVVVASWWLTAPLEPIGSEDGPATLRTTQDGPDPGPAGDPDTLAEWPEGRLEGRPAKRYLLEFMEQAVRRLDRAAGYTATLTRQERIDGELGPEQRLRIKIQHDPFAVFLRFESPRPGKEALYHRGRFDDQLLAHNGDWTRRFIPRLKLDPEGPIALADNRHPITEVGLAHLSRKLLHFRRLDLDDPHAETVLDRATDEHGTPWFRSIHSHAVHADDRPFAYVEIRYCPEFLLPLHIVSHDWPEPGLEAEELKLAERYHYEDVDFDVSFTTLDFDPTNPEYGFQRY